jgi:mannose-1-phosphate guanylyltransferase/phosphomannomutase
MGDRLRKLVERQFSRQELRRAAAPDVGATTYPARVRESYAQDLLDGIDAERVRERGFRVAIDFGHSAASFTLPLVLGPLGVDAIGLHGFLADAPDLPELGTDDVRRIVTAVGADLGVVVDRAAERLRLVDERGEEIPPELGLLLVVRLLALAGRDGVVAVPVTASSLVDSVAEGSGIVVRRTAHSIAALTAAAAESGVLCAAAPTGGFVFPDVVAGYDAVGALCKLLELLAILDRPLSAVVAELPRPTLVTDSAPCPLGRKGGVMRVLGEQLADRRLELLDGVKAYDHRGSVQAIPDQIEPVIHVFAEGRTRVESLALAREVLATIDAALEAGRQGGADGRRTSDQVST